MSHLSANLLGALDLRLADQPITTLEYDKVRALLIYLMVESGQPHRRGTLAGLYWPDFSERAARQNLSQALLVLRRAIGDHEANPPFLNITKQTMQFNTNSDYTLDVSDFTALIDAAQQHQHTDLVTCNDCLLALEQAAALYRGDLLTGFSLPNCPEFEIWLTLVRERLQQRAMDAFYHLVEAFLLRANYGSALKYAQRQLALDNLREPAYRQAMTALALSGQRSAALIQYETCERVLQAELDISPEPKTTALYEQISGGAYNGKQPGRPIVEAVIDSNDPQHNLPLQLTPIIGRDTERDALVDLLRQPDSRLVTLTGFGGCGKTRLALEVAWSLVGKIPQGVWFVPMASFDSVEAVINGIANALGVPLSEHAISTAGRDKKVSLLDQLQVILRHRTALLVLDNAEQLVQSNDDEVTLTGVLTAILEHAPGVKMLVTSRSILHSAGEIVVPLRPLDYPGDHDETLDTLTTSATVQLFLHAARRTRPEFTLAEHNQQAVAAICNYVQGCPLATLLAAAWTTTLSTAEIAGMLMHPDDDLSSLDMLQSDWQDIPARHRDLRSVYEYSWRLLTPKAQKVFAVCCLFRGGFSWNAAREIARANAFDLRLLVEASLLSRQPSGRYMIHELLRQFGEEKLQRDSIEGRNARLRYTDYYIPLISQWEQDVIGPHQMAVLNAIDLEIDNARALWYWTIADGDFDVFLRIQAGLLHYYAHRYRNTDIVSLCDYVLELEEPLLDMPDLDTNIPLVLGHAYYRKALHGPEQQREHCLGKIEGLLAHQQFVDSDRKYMQARVLYLRGTWNVMRDNPAAQEQLGLATQLFLEFGHVWDAGWATYNLAWCYWHDSQMDLSQQYFEKAIAISQDAGDPVLEIAVLQGFGGVLVGRGQFAGAIENSRQAVQAARVLRNPAVLARQLFSCGIRHIMNGKFQDSVGFLNESIANQIAAYGAVDTLTLSGMGLAHVNLGAYAEAETWMDKAFDKLREYPNQRNRAWCSLILGMAKSGLNKLTEADDLYTQAIEIYAAIGQWVELAMAHCMLTYIYAMRGNLEQAGTQLVQATRIALEHKAMVSVGWIIAGFALLTAKLDQAERAVELWSGVCSLPLYGNSQWIADVVGQQVDAASSLISKKAIAAAEERGRELSLWETVEALVAELEQGWA